MNLFEFIIGNVVLIVVFTLLLLLYQRFMIRKRLKSGIYKDLHLPP